MYGLKKCQDYEGKLENGKEKENDGMIVIEFNQYWTGKVGNCQECIIEADNW